MGVDVVGRAVGGPAGVPDAEPVPGQRLLGQQLLQVGELAGLLGHVQLAVGHDAPRRRSRSRGTPAAAGPRPRPRGRPAGRRTRRFHTCARLYRRDLRRPDLRAADLRARWCWSDSPRAAGARPASTARTWSASRADWAELAEQTPISLDAATLERVRGLGDPTSMLDVREVYLPLTRLLSRYFLHTSELHRSTNDFLQLDVGRTPFVIGDRRLGRGRQVDHRPAAARAAGRLARAPAGVPGHHRRVPAAQRRAGASRPDAPQGLPGVLRPARPCCAS